MGEKDLSIFKLIRKSICLRQIRLSGHHPDGFKLPFYVGNGTF
jgi:hypothetical protein